MSEGLKGEFSETEKTFGLPCGWICSRARREALSTAPAQRHRRPYVAGSLLPRSCPDPSYSPLTLSLVVAVRTANDHQSDHLPNALVGIIGSGTYPSLIMPRSPQTRFKHMCTCATHPITPSPNSSYPTYTWRCKLPIGHTLQVQSLDGFARANLELDHQLKGHAPPRRYAHLLARLLDLLQEGVVRDRAFHDDLLLLEADIIAVDAEACIRRLPVSN